MYNYNCNIILVEPIVNRHAINITKAGWKYYAAIQHSDHALTLYILDNKYSTDMRAAFKQDNVPFQNIYHTSLNKV